MPQLICPVCASPLIHHEKFYQCEQHHTFDIARQGYVNLHLVNQKKTHEPGDNKEMVVARDAFLHRHHYAPISEAIVDYVESKLSATKVAIADIGCGVGYYLSTLQYALQFSAVDIDFYGVDISKEAIKVASKNKHITWLVASGKKLPFPDSSLDFVISVFSPFYSDEILRLLKPDGTLIVVTPAKNHLIELKSVLFDRVDEHDDEKNLLKYSEKFIETQMRLIQADFELTTSVDIDNLLKMTPYYFKSTAAKREEVRVLNQLKLSLDVVLRCFKKRLISTQE